MPLRHAMLIITSLSIILRRAAAARCFRFDYYHTFRYAAYGAAATFSREVLRCSAQRACVCAR